MIMKRIPVQVHLDPSDRELLEQLAHKQGLSISDAIRLAIRRWALDEAGEADPVLGLIGSIDGLPPDLSTHHDAYAAGGY
jgi:hypothetical protein